MQSLVNKNIDFWVRPWNIEKFDDSYNRDERFFSIVIKGLLSWLNDNMLMYNKSIRHFIFNTGSSYLYIEKNGYENTWCETTGEDLMYMELPRCLVSVGNFSIPTEELTAPYAQGIYERKSTATETNGQILAYTAEIERLPIEISVSLKYIFSNFNESIIFIQELFENILFQQYFNIIYLGQNIQCSLEIQGDTNINLTDIDLAAQEANRRTIEFEIKVCTNMPIINVKTETKADKVIVYPSMETKVNNYTETYNIKLNNIFI